MKTIFQKNLVLYSKAIILGSIYLIVLLNPCSVRPEFAKGTLKKNPFIIMIAPAGDVKNKGRTIDGSSELAITLALAQALARHIEQQTPFIRVIITHGAHETIAPLAHANFANRMQADLYLSLNCYHEEKPIPQLALYQFSYGEFMPTQKNKLAFYPFDQAHLLDVEKNQRYGHLLEVKLKKYHKQFQSFDILTLPFKPLIGIKVPAIGIELGIKNKNEWRTFIDPLVESLIELVPSS